MTIITMNGRKNTATAELKSEFKKLKKALPKHWKRTYINQFHSTTKGVAVYDVINRLQNIQIGRVAPTLTELSRFEKIKQ